MSSRIILCVNLLAEIKKGLLSVGNNIPIKVSFYDSPLTLSHIEVYIDPLYRAFVPKVYCGWKVIVKDEFKPSLDDFISIDELISAVNNFKS